MTDAGKEAVVDLKPCPMCGGKAHALTGMAQFVDVEITCTNCALTGGNESEGETREKNLSAAAEAWNRRAASGEAGLAGYEAAEQRNTPTWPLGGRAAADAIMKSPTQGGGAGDRETVAAIICPWAARVVASGAYHAKAKHEYCEALTKADQIIAALQAAPSEGGEPRFLGHLIEREGHQSIFVPAGEPIPLVNSCTVTPAYDGPQNVTARPPAPSEGGEPVAWCIPGVLATMKAEGLSGEIMPVADDEFSQPLYALPPAPSEGGEPVAWREALEPFDVVGIPAWGDDEKVHLTCDGQSLGSIRLGAFRRLAAARPPAPSEGPLVGCVVVPREPTEAMVEAGRAAGKTAFVDPTPEEIWPAMLAAAPAPDAIRGRPESPEPPWPIGRDNAKRAGWKAFYEGRDREKCPFPPARDDLQRAFRVGWDAAKEKSDGAA